MAKKKDGERRMVFDTGGRRRGVVKVVYAILAVLMGFSLLLVVGPAPLQEIFGVKDEVSRAADQFEEQAEKAEQKLKKNPEDSALLLSLTRARINAGNSLAEANPETGEIAYTPESVQQLQAASESWSKYLKSTDEPNPGAAQVAAQALYGLAQNSRTVSEVKLNIRAAVAAQQIVAEARPSIGSLSTLAIYRLNAFDYEGAAQAQKEARPYANTKFERENLDNELKQINKSAHEFQKRLIKYEKEVKEAREKGEPAAANPLSEENPLSGG
jgi:hypothetical protein